VSVDSIDKRASATLVSMPFRAVLPQPGTMDAGDRPEIVFLYRGIVDEGGSSPPPVTAVDWLTPARRRGRR